MAFYRLLLVLFLVGACSVKAQPGPLSPNVAPPSKPQGSARIVGFEVPDGDICAHKKGMKDLCVSGMRESLGSGFTDLMTKFFTASAGPDAYSAEFRFVELQQRSVPAKSGSAVATELSMAWRFMLKDASGKVRVDVAEQTVGPEEMINVSNVASANHAVTVLLNAVLERIAKAITDAKLDESAEADAAAAAEAVTVAATLCVPGATQECVGPAACKGGQSCLPDGTGFSPCNCGEVAPEPAKK